MFVYGFSKVSKVKELAKWKHRTQTKQPSKN
jgi:hypothetical protein